VTQKYNTTNADLLYIMWNAFPNVKSWAMHRR